MIIYRLDFAPKITDASETFRKNYLIRKNQEMLKKMLGPFIHSGDNIFAFEESGEGIEFKTETRGGKAYNVYIEQVSSFDMEDLSTLKNADHGVAMNFLNLIVKSALRQSDMKQIGNLPRYFLPKNRRRVEFLDMEVWPGFQTTTAIYKGGFFLTIECLNKFISSRSCLDVIKEMLAEGASKRDVEEYFENTTIITNYGSQRSYRVNGIDFKNSALKHSFVASREGKEEKKLNMLEYFREFYNVKLLDKD